MPQETKEHKDYQPLSCFLHVAVNGIPLMLSLLEIETVTFVRRDYEYPQQNWFYQIDFKSGQGTMRWRKTLFQATILCLCWMVAVPTVQGQYYFGRNKIQYNRFEWQVLTTEHFDIYFYPEMEALAEMGAFFAEESYRILQDKFNHNVLRKIPLIFYSSHFHFEETNTLPYTISPAIAGFFEFIKGRVVVPSDGSLSRFRKTIRHELVHVFQRSYVERVLKDHRMVQDRGIPLWFEEGLAEYWSEGWSSEAEMIIRDGVLYNKIVPLPQMYLISGTYTMYKEGQAILKYISERYGEEKILQLMDNVWKSDMFSGVMKMTIGKDYRELNEEWSYHLKKTIYPLMVEKDLPRMVTSRITERGYNSLPAFYRDGKTPRVVFDQLTLSGFLPSGHFICIGPAGADSTAGSLGQLFLTRKEGAENYQLLVILVPAVQSADQIKAQARDTSW